MAGGNGDSVVNDENYDHDDGDDDDDDDDDDNDEEAERKKNERERGRTVMFRGRSLNVSRQSARLEILSEYQRITRHRGRAHTHLVNRSCPHLELRTLTRA